MRTTKKRQSSGEDGEPRRSECPERTTVRCLICGLRMRCQLQPVPQWNHAHAPQGSRPAAWIKGVRRTPGNLENSHSAVERPC